MYKKEAL